MHHIILFLFCFITLLSSCAGKSPKEDDANVAVDKQRLISINKYLADKDKDIIEHFIRRKGWKMHPSPDGYYYYEVFNEGSPPKAIAGDQVMYNYTVGLLDGTVCYSSYDGDEPKSFVVGGSEEISGMHYAVKMLGKGGKARFIFPPQSAYGLQGDFNKIPPRSILLYNVEVTDILHGR